MQPVLDAKGLRNVETATMQAQGVDEVALVQRAAEAATGWLLSRFAPHIPFRVLCGMGNNGADGLGVARRLHQAGRTVECFRFRHKELPSGANARTFSQAEEAGVRLHEIEQGSALPRSVGNEVVIDALFGIGLDRALTGWLKEVVATVNASPNPVISLDLPSGLLLSGSTTDPEAIVQADHTLSFGAVKLPFLLADQYKWVGEWTVLPIGLDEAAMAKEQSPFVCLERADVLELMPPRERFSHKGTFGHAWLLGGSQGKMGAALLMANAALRSGTGLITLRVPAGNEALVLGLLPEVMVSSDPADHLSELPPMERCDTIGFGPGIGEHADTARLMHELLRTPRVPLVLDADAINILAANTLWLELLPKGSILTPHPKEFDRLTGPAITDIERLERARRFAQEHDVVLVLKGAYSAVCAPDGTVRFNTTGNPGMAKGGSGDALTGVITALLAQGLSSLDAAVLGVHAHGLAGDLAAGELGMDGMRIMDLMDHLPAAWQLLRRPS